MHAVSISHYSECMTKTYFKAGCFRKINVLMRNCCIIEIYFNFIGFPHLSCLYLTLSNCGTKIFRIPNLDASEKILAKIFYDTSICFRALLGDQS